MKLYLLLAFSLGGIYFIKPKVTTTYSNLLTLVSMETTNILALPSLYLSLSSFIRIRHVCKCTFRVITFC